MNKKFGKVGVFFGGSSNEREISLISGRNILQALHTKNIDAYAFDPSKHNLIALVTEKFDRVFIALHGRYGEDGIIQGILEQLCIPYTGSGVMASAIAMNKIITKRIWLTYNLPTPRFIVLDNTIKSNKQLKKILHVLGLPLILKPPHEGSTIGIIKVTDYSTVESNFKLCAQYDLLILAEEFIVGREFTVPVLGYGSSAYALPVIEICAPEGNYNYQNKYFNNTTKYFCPAQLNAELTKRIQILAIKSFNAIHCRGWARVDFMLRTKDNALFLLEINTSPGMTKNSLVPLSAKAIGIEYEDLCYKILKTASLNTKVCI